MLSILVICFETRCFNKNDLIICRQLLFVYREQINLSLLCNYYTVVEGGSTYVLLFDKPHGGL